MIMKRQQRVMFVDDEEGVRQSWDRLLTERGFKVSTAEDGAGAKLRLEEEPADVVVADLRMPRVDGLQLLEWIKREQPDTRFILVTGYGSDVVERRARELGAYGYLNKPVDPEMLSQVITLALQLDLRTGEVTGRAVPADVAAIRPVDVAPATARKETPTEVAFPVPAPEIPVAAPAPAPARRSRLLGALEVVGGLIMAPLMGLAFVLFLPLIGFGGLFWVIGEAIWKRAGASGA
jgi:CheY-like chemotaxis protein